MFMLPQTREFVDVGTKVYWREKRTNKIRTGEIVKITRKRIVPHFWIKGNLVKATPYARNSYLVRRDKAVDAYACDIFFLTGTSLRVNHTLQL